MKYIVELVTRHLHLRVASVMLYWLPCKVKGMFNNGVDGELCSGLVFSILQFSKSIFRYLFIDICSWDEKQPESPEAFVLFLDFTQRYSFTMFFPEGGSVSVSSLYFHLWYFGLPYYLFQFCLLSSRERVSAFAFSICECLSYFKSINSSWFQKIFT